MKNLTAHDLEMLELAISELRELHAYCVANARKLNWTKQQAECNHECPTYEAIRGLEAIIAEVDV